MQFPVITHNARKMRCWLLVFANDVGSQIAIAITSTGSASTGIIWATNLSNWPVQGSARPQHGAPRALNCIGNLSVAGCGQGCLFLTAGFSSCSHCSFVYIVYMVLLVVLLFDQTPLHGSCQNFARIAMAGTFHHLFKRFGRIFHHVSKKAHLGWNLQR